MIVIIVSSVITSLNENNAKTSSEKFELILAKNIAKKVSKVFIYNFNNEEKNIYSDGNISLITQENELFDIGKESDFKKIVIIFGYNPKSIIYGLKIRKKLDGKLVSYIFDTHKNIYSYRKFYRRIQICLYYAFGIHLIKRLDGIILLNKSVVRIFKLKNPILISKVGYSNLLNYKIDNINEFYTVLFVGSLINHNGILETIQAFNSMEITKEKAKLRIFGDGPLKDLVLERSKDNCNIHYGGLIPNSELYIEYEKADLLLNVRDPNNYVNKFSFPSKMIEFMETGRSVASTNFDNWTEKQLEMVYLIEKFSVSSISQAILNHFHSDENSKQIKKTMMQDYLYKNHNWEDISNSMISFFLKL